MRYYEYPDDANGLRHKAAHGREMVRLRPGMYIGGTDLRALHHLIYEVLDNSAEEAASGRCSTIQITLEPDHVVTLQDSSEGLPVDTHELSGFSKLELLFTVIHMRKEQLSPEDYLVPIYGGLHGVGLSAVNMLCEWLVVQVARDGFLWQQSYQTGIAQGAVEQLRALTSEDVLGIKISFRPDPTIFDLAGPELAFNFETVSRRCEDIAYQIAGLRIAVTDQRSHLTRTNSYYMENGLQTLIDNIRTAEQQPIHSVIHANFETSVPLRPREGQNQFHVGVEFAFQFTTGDEPQEVDFINTVHSAGGTHIEALRKSIVTVLNKHRPSSERPFRYSQISAGLIAVISLRHPEPKFLSPTRSIVYNPEILGTISQAIAKEIESFATTHPTQMQRIIDHCIANRNTRHA